MCETLKDWHKNNKTYAPYPALDEIILKRSKYDFPVSALPITKTVDLVAECCARLSAGSVISENEEVITYMYHDRANYNIVVGLSADEFKCVLVKRFFAHPFSMQISETINPEVYFGAIKVVQNNCVGGSIPSKRDLTGNVQVLYDLFVSLDNEMYVVDRVKALTAI